MRRVLFAAAALGALSFAGAASAQPAAKAPTTAVPGGSAASESTAAPRFGTFGYDTAARDPSVKPGDDFYNYAEGSAIAKLQIPPDRARYGAFDGLSELSTRRVHAILEQAAATGGAPSTPQGKVGAFYKAFMDEGRVEALGTRPLAADLAQVSAIKSRAELTRLMGRSNDGYFASVFDFGISPDEKDPNHYVVYLNQGGLGMPDRDYYLTPAFATKKAAYQAYVAQLLTLSGWPDPAGNAARIVAFETGIAQVSWTRAEQRNPDNTYKPTTVEALSTASPQFGWPTLLTEARLAAPPKVIVQEDTAFPKIAALYQATPLDTLKAWEAFHVADNAAPFLSRAFVDAHFQFHNKTLQGQLELKPRWKRAVATVDGGMGEAVGQVYVARYFTPEAKAKMQALIGDLKTAFAARLQTLDWMGPATKAEAEQKLARYVVKIGYPDKWRDYSALQISPDDLYGDVRRANAFEWARQVKRLNGPVDRAEWDMTPQTVNAYNNPVFNEVVFPAAILQPPFFDPEADPAVNYGAIGGVIGHEMTHGFDDEGRKYDSTGSLRDWWTKEDAARFDARAKRLGAEYAAVEPVPGAHINPELTMGENIADLGGITLALDAYHASLHGRPAPVIDGLTGDQRVFLGWAQVWRAKARQDDERQRLATDPHSPAAARANEPVHNLDAWYAAFHVQPGQKMYLAPADRVRIW